MMGTILPWDVSSDRRASKLGTLLEQRRGGQRSTDTARELDWESSKTMGQSGSTIPSRVLFSYVQMTLSFTASMRSTTGSLPWGRELLQSELPRSYSAVGTTRSLCNLKYDPCSLQRKDAAVSKDRRGNLAAAAERKTGRVRMRMQEARMILANRGLWFAKLRDYGSCGWRSCAEVMGDPCRVRHDRCRRAVVSARRVRYWLLADRALEPGVRLDGSALPEHQICWTARSL